MTVTESTNLRGALSDEQRARGAALIIAADVLSGKTFGGRSSVEGSELLDVADYVMNGRPATTDVALTTCHEADGDPLATVKSWAAGNPPPEAERRGTPEDWAHGYQWAQQHVAEILGQSGILVPSL